MWQVGVFVKVWRWLKICLRSLYSGLLVSCAFQVKELVGIPLRRKATRRPQKPGLHFGGGAVPSFSGMSVVMYVCRYARPAWVRPESAICTEVSTLDTTEIARNGTEAAAQLLPSMQGSHPRNLLQEGVCCKGHEYKDGGYFSIFQLPAKDLVVDDAASMVVLLFVAVLVLWEIENPTGSQISKIIDVDCENG